MAERLNKDNFESTVKAEKLAIVDFYSDSCIPCKKLNPILGDLEDESEGKLKVYKVNVNFDSEIAEKFEVLSTPTLIQLKNGEEVDRKSGFQSKEVLENWLKY